MNNTTISKSLEVSECVKNTKRFASVAVLLLPGVFIFGDQGSKCDSRVF
jgi:hypothetical protein